MERAAHATGTSLVPFPAAAYTASVGLRARHIVWGTGLLLALSVGAFGLTTVRFGAGAMATARGAQVDATATVLHRLEDEVGRLKSSVDTLRASTDARQDESMRGLKRSVDNLKQEIEQVKASDGATLAQLSSKIDKSDHDPSPKLAEIMTRLEKLDREPNQKTADLASQRLTDVQSRLERVERQVSSTATTGSIAAVATPRATLAKAALQMPVASPLKPAPRPEMSSQPLTEAKPLPAKPATVDGWVVRDVYDGMALVEGRSGGLREIAPGEFLPGAGEVRSIERRGRSWVVLTSRGVIENSTF